MSAVHTPTSLAEVRDAVGGEGTMAVRGGGTKPPADAVEADRVVSTLGLGRLLAYNPADMTATVGAGMRLSVLQAHLATHHQWLAVDPPWVEAGATVGGVYAAGDHGPRRQRYGTMRDLVIGSTVVLADGAVSRAGGNVIKNVAGYDLCKLWHGSWGTLAVVVEVTVRLHPLPPSAATVRFAMQVRHATTLLLDLLAAPLEPVAVDWEGGSEGWLAVCFEGRRDGVESQLQQLDGLVRERPVDGVERLHGREHDALWARLREGHGGGQGETVVRAATSPEHLAEVVTTAQRVAAAEGLEVRLHSHAGLGLHTMRLAGGGAGAHAAVLAAWGAAVRRLGGHVLARRVVEGLAPPAVHSTEGAARLMRRVKEQFDPLGRLPSPPIGVAP